MVTGVLEFRLGGRHESQTLFELLMNQIGPLTFKAHLPIRVEITLICQPCAPVFQQLTNPFWANFVWRNNSTHSLTARLLCEHFILKGKNSEIFIKDLYSHNPLATIELRAKFALNGRNATWMSAYNSWRTRDQYVPIVWIFTSRIILQE